MTQDPEFIAEMNSLGDLSPFCDADHFTPR
jgi:hypothetical protein